MRVVEITELAGSAGHAMRSDYARAERKQIEERLAGYVRSTYKAKTLARWQTSDFYDVGRPLRIELETADAGIGTVTDEHRDGGAASLRAVRAAARLSARPRGGGAQARRCLGRAHGRLRL